MSNAELNSAIEWVDDLQNQLHHLSVAVQPYYTYQEQTKLQESIEGAMRQLAQTKATFEQFRLWNRIGYPRGNAYD